MTSERQVAANRLNAQKSTGPRSRNGKLRSRRNALRHGLTAETVLEHAEDPAEYRTFERAIIADFSPASTIERALVVRLASLLWRLRRATAMETGLLANPPPSDHQPATTNFGSAVHIADATLLTRADPASYAVQLMMSLISARTFEHVDKHTSGHCKDNNGLSGGGFRWALMTNQESFALVLRYQTALSRQLMQTLMSIAQVRHNVGYGQLLRRRGQKPARLQR